MRSVGLLFFTLVVAVSVTAQEAGDYADLPEYRVFGSPASASDAEEIEELMERFSRAWGARDVEALMETYTEDAEWTNAFGMVRRGHEELREMFSWLFEHFGAPADAEGTTSTGDAEGDESEDTEQDGELRSGRVSLRYIGSRAAVIQSFTHSDWGENRDGGGLRRVLITYVLEKRDGEWRIGHQMIMDARR